MKLRLQSGRLPEGRTVAEFNFRGCKEQYWLILAQRDTSVCLTHPGFEIDLWIEADLSAFFQVWLGRLAFADALSRNLVVVRSTPVLERSFPEWFAWNPAAEVVRATTRRDRKQTSAIAGRGN